MRAVNRTWFQALIRVFRWGCGLLAVHVSVMALPASDAKGPAPAIHEIRLFLTSEAQSHLVTHPRDLVPVQLTWDGTNVPHAQLRLKGSTGSFRPLPDRPSFTVVWDLPSTAEAPEGRRTRHLNNAVEDPSRLQQALAASWFREAGVPAPLIDHARVSLNGNRLGVYVIEEGVDAAYLKREFPGASARSLGEDDRISTLEALQESGDVVALRRALEQAVDVAECLRYFAVEAVAGHRDGYLAARNNFRLVELMATHRRVIVPHGMDQFIGTPEFPWNPAPGGRLAQWILSQPAGRERFEAEVRALAMTLGDEAAWVSRFDRLALPWIASLTADEAAEFVPAVDILRERLRGRARGVIRQLAALASSSDAPILVGETRRLTAWRREILEAPSEAHGEPAGAGSDPGGTSGLHARLDHDGVAIWKTSLRLAPGRYRFEGRVRTHELVPARLGRRHGATLRVGGQDATGGALLGTRDWTPQSVTMDLHQANPATAAMVEIELLCEVRARSGEAWFDADSLIVRRVE